jgi:hypothetical protein
VDIAGKQALQTHGASAGGMSPWHTKRAKVLAAVVLLGIVWLWLGSGTGTLQPALHHFVKVEGTQVDVTSAWVPCCHRYVPTG